MDDVIITVYCANTLGKFGSNPHTLPGRGGGGGNTLILRCISIIAIAAEARIKLFKSGKD